jgi:hypothetical protein
VGDAWAPIKKGFPGALRTSWKGNGNTKRRGTGSVERPEDSRGLFVILAGSPRLNAAFADLVTPVHKRFHDPRLVPYSPTARDWPMPRFELSQLHESVVIINFLNDEPRAFLLYGRHYISRQSSCIELSRSRR